MTPHAAPAAAPAPRRGYGALLADRRYLLFLAAAFVNLTVYLQSVAVLPLAMRDAGLPTAWYGAMFLLNGLVVLTLQLPVTRVVQRRPAAGVVTLGFALLAAGHAVYWLPAAVLPVAVPIGAVFVAGTVVWSVAEIVGGPTVAAWPSLAAPAGLQGRYQGAFQAAFGLGSAVGPVLGVVLWSRLGPITWLVSAAAALVALVAARAAMRTGEPGAGTATTPTATPTGTATTPTQPATPTRPATTELQEQSS